jgi:hypothetical protein
MALRRQSRHGNVVVPLVVALIFIVGLAGYTGGQIVAQERPVQIEGRVQWVAGQTAMLHLDGGTSVSVDLAGVAQDAYAVLKPRERVAVAGVLSGDGRRVIASEIMRRNGPPQSTQ